MAKKKVKSKKQPEGAARNLETLPPHFCEPIPRDVVNTWLDGKYSVGLQRSVAYDMLGWALMLRGFYRYEAFGSPGQNNHWGFCFFDLYDGELQCNGIRVSTGSAWPNIRHKPHPMLWRSDVCDIRPLVFANGARLTCGYRIRTPDQWHGREGVDTDFAAHMSTDERRPDILESLAVNYLSKYYENDWEKIKRETRKQQEAMLQEIAKEKLATYLIRFRKQRAKEHKTRQVEFSPQHLALSKGLRKRLDAIVDGFKPLKKLTAASDPNQQPSASLESVHGRLDKCLDKLAKKRVQKAVTSAVRKELKEASEDSMIMACVTREARNYVKRTITDLQEQIRPVKRGGFIADLKKTDSPLLKVVGNYGAFGETPVGGKIEFCRIPTGARI